MKSYLIFQASYYTFLLVIALILSYFLFGTLPQALGITISNLTIEIIYIIAVCWYIVFVILLNKKWDIKLRNYLHFTVKWREIVFTFLFSVAATIVSIMVIDSIENWTDLISGKINTIKISSEWSLLYGIRLFRSVVIAPFCEELFFRGVLLTFLLRKFSASKAILITSLLFAVSHIRFEDFFMLLFWGMIFGYLFYKTKSLWVSFLSHSLTNFISLNIVIEGVTIRMVNSCVFFILGVAILLIIGLIVKQKCFFISEKSKNEI